MVVEPRAGLGQERWLADRLPDRESADGRTRQVGEHLEEDSLFRSCTADHRLRPCPLRSRPTSRPRPSRGAPARRARDPEDAAAAGARRGVPGFPNQVTESALQAWLKDVHVSNAQIGIFTYVALPYLLKPLWAPLLDRYALPGLGRRRGWMLVAQVMLVAAMTLLAFQDPLLYAGRRIDLRGRDRVHVGEPGHRHRRVQGGCRRSRGARSRGHGKYDRLSRRLVRRPGGRARCRRLLRLATRAARRRRDDGAVRAGDAVGAGTRAPRCARIARRIGRRCDQGTARETRRSRSARARAAVQARRCVLAEAVHALHDGRGLLEVRRSASSSRRCGSARRWPDRRSAASG